MPVVEAMGSFSAPLLVAVSIGLSIGLCFIGRLVSSCALSTCCRLALCFGLYRSALCSINSSIDGLCSIGGSIDGACALSMACALSTSLVIYRGLVLYRRRLCFIAGCALSTAVLYRWLCSIDGLCSIDDALSTACALSVACRRLVLYRL